MGHRKYVVQINFLYYKSNAGNQLVTRTTKKGIFSILNFELRSLNFEFCLQFRLPTLFVFTSPQTIYLLVCVEDATAHRVNLQ